MPEVYLQDDELIWSMEEATSTGAGGKLLESFLNLRGATDERIRDFAQRYGVLELCERHHVPATHPRFSPRADSCAPSRRDAWYAEPVQPYREWAEAFDRIISVAGRIYDGGGVQEETWQFFASWPQRRGAEPLLSEPLRAGGRSSIEVERLKLSLVINTLISWADLDPILLWFGEERPRVELVPSSLFSALTLRLALNVARTDLSRCVACGTFFQQERKRGRPLKYCDACREDNAPQRLADERRR